jgi:hypothetical protein
MVRSALFAALLCSACPAQAEFRFDLPEVEQAFVEANLLGIFYHELGHALIDILDLPIFGQEEDAADVLSVVLIDALFDEETAVGLAVDTAFGCLGEEDSVDDPVFWGVHGPDEQRYYNLVCLFYGANPDQREELAIEMGLPEQRAWTCPQEYDQAIDSWGSVLDEIATETGGRSIRFMEEDDGGEAWQFTSEVLKTEVDALNRDFNLPSRLEVRVDYCGEANAFYDPQRTEIVMCAEFTDALAQMAEDTSK